VVSSFLNQSLFSLLSDFQNRPSKAFRSELVRFGFALCFDRALSPEQNNLALACAQILEDLHAGSLIVDDIQDNSKVRRGELCLHQKYDLGLALNAGNFLYFQALRQIQILAVSEDLKLQILNLVVNILWEAHQGQALDLHLKAENLTRTEIIATSGKILRAKSGALTSLALQLGPILSDQPKLQNALSIFGARFGECLQRFDDLGNLQQDWPNEKNLEDLQNHRVTYLWSFLAQYASEDLFLEMQSWLRNPQPVRQKQAQLNTFLKQENILARALFAAKTELHEALTEFRKHLNSPNQQRVFKDLLHLSERLTHAYQQPKPDSPQQTSQDHPQEDRCDRQWIWGACDSDPSASRRIPSPNF
jgi:geranylgeranyl pyrophosphate synthase